MSLNLKRHTGALQLVFVVGIVGAAVLMSSALKPEAAARRPAAAPTGLAVSTVAAERVDFSPVVRLNGVVQARTITNLVPQVSGRIVMVSDAFRPGERVSAGDILFVIDPADYELAVERTLAEIEAARSELALLEAEAAAERTIWNNQFPERDIPDLIARVPQIAAAKARIKSGEAARRSAELSLERTAVKALFDARVLETQLDVGQVVGTAASVGSLFSIDSLEIAVPVSEEDARLVGELVGSRAAINGGRVAGTLGGEITRTSAALDETTRLLTVFVAADAPDALTVGDFVDVTIEGRSMPDAYRIPTAAFTSRDQIWVVADGRLERRTLEVLGADGDMTTVAPFDDADGVVAVPPSNVRAGLDVEAEPLTSLATTGGPSRGAR